MPELSETIASARAQLSGGDPQGAWRTLAPAASWPTHELEDQFPIVFSVLADCARGFGAAEAGEAMARAAASPDDPNALYQCGYALYEAGQHAVAAAALARANRVAPGQAAIVSELISCLEHTLQYGHGALVAEASGLVGVDPIVSYLAGFCWFMAGDVEQAQARLLHLEGVEQGPVPEMRAALRAMVERAQAVQGAGITLDDDALRGWQYAVNGTLLLHESPHGWPDPMHGRYAFLNDSPGLMKEGLDGLQAALAAMNLPVTRVVAAPDRASRVLGTAAAWRFGKPLTPWSPGAEQGALVVVWSMEAVGEPAFYQALHTRAPGQILFVHASDWVNPFPYAPDITTCLAQTVLNPFTGGALQVNPQTQQVERAGPDPRSDVELAAEIQRARLSDPSATPVDLALARLAPGGWKPGFRLRQRAGGPVLSNRFL